MSVERAGHAFPRRFAAWAVVGVVVGLTAVGYYRNQDEVPLVWVGLVAAIAASFTAMGRLILAGLPGHPVGRLMLFAGLGSAVALLTAAWVSVPMLAWLAQWTWLIPFGLILLALLVFPDGELPSRWWRILAAGIVVTVGGGALGLAVAALEGPHTMLTAAVPLTESWALTAAAVAVVLLLFAGVALLAVIVALGLRWRRAAGQTRHQIACLFLAGCLLVPAALLDTLNVTGAWILVALVVPAAMTLAVLRFSLYGLDRLINRTFVWLIMTFLVIAAFVAIVTVLRDVLVRLDTSSASLAATGLIAVAFEPVRERVQRGVNHLLYGERDEPYRVVARLGELAGRSVEQTAVLPLLTKTIASSLQVPYVAIEEDGGRAGTWLVAEHGTPTPAPPERFDMIAHGERIGRLVVAPRTTGTRFGAPERRLLSSVALHAAIALDATRLVRDLRSSRERLVMAREEERRRLRRDLHDGFGPTVAGMAAQVHAARKLVRDEDRVADRLDTLARDLRTCMSEVRRLIDELRPFALDSGLGPALTAECGKMTGPAFEVSLRLPDDLDGLPGPVELAAYRIFCEALSNAIRHSAASTCLVTVAKDRELSLEIADDGVGADGRASEGVGLASMRERAEELGGTFEVARREPRGTAVRVCLPLRLDSHRPTGPSPGARVPERAG